MIGMRDILYGHTTDTLQHKLSNNLNEGHCSNLRCRSRHLSDQVWHDGYTPSRKRYRGRSNIERGSFGSIASCQGWQ